MPDRSDDNVVWASSANNVQHIDMRTGMMIGSTPWPTGRGGGGEPAEGGGRGGPVADRPFRRNWAIPLAMSTRTAAIPPCAQRLPWCFSGSTSMYAIPSRFGPMFIFTPRRR